MTDAPTISPLNPINLGYVSGLASVHQYTYRDGISYAELVESLSSYIQDTLVPYINTEFPLLEESYGEQLAAALAAIAAADVPITDPVITAALNSPGSASSGAVMGLVARVLGWAIVTDPQWAGGADSTGVTDSTAAINAAWTGRGNKPMYFPAGDFVYTQNGLNVTATDQFAVYGAGPRQTTIHLSQGNYFLNPVTNGIHSVHVKDIATDGGAGLFQSLRTSPQVVDSGFVLFENIVGTGFTGAYIERNSQDWPNWTFRKVTLEGANYTTTIGFALSGLTDGVVIDDVSMSGVRVGVKLDRGGNNAVIRDFGYVRGDNNTRSNATVPVWLVPTADGQNDGQGMLIDHVRFGNENTQNLDKHIVVADEMTSGTTFGSKFPNLTTYSTNNIESLRVRDCMFSGSDAGHASPIFSTTNNIRGLRVDGALNGTPPRMIVEFLTPKTSPDTNGQNIIGPFIGPGLIQGPYDEIRATNDDGFATVIDPAGIFAAFPARTITDSAAEDHVDWVRLLTTKAGAFTAVGGATSVTGQNSVPNAIANDGAVVNLAAGGYVAGTFAAAVVAGHPTHVSFDANTGTLDKLRVRVVNSSGVTEYARVIQMFGDAFYPYQFDFIPRAGGTNYQIVFEHPTGSAGNFKIQRVRVYHGRTRSNQDGTVIIQGARYQLSVSSGVITATPV